MSSLEERLLARLNSLTGGHAVDSPERVLLEFVLENGKKCIPGPLPLGIDQGAPKQCFCNAAELPVARPELVYAEGYSHDGYHGLFHHAWCIDSDSNVIDPTLKSPEKHEYFGVPLVSVSVENLMIREFGFFGPVLLHIARHPECHEEFLYRSLG